MHRCWHSESLICGSLGRRLAATVPGYARDHGPFASSRGQVTYQSLGMLHHSKDQGPIEKPARGLLRVLGFSYEKLEKQSLWSFVARPKRLLIHHSSSNSALLGLLCHVLVVNVEHHLLPQLSLSRNFVELCVNSARTAGASGDALCRSTSHLATATFMGGKEQICAH